MPTLQSHEAEGCAIEIRVCGPDCEPMMDAEIRRLFPGGTLTAQRLDRLRALPRVIVLMGDRTVGVATYQKVDDELRVPDFDVDGSVSGLRLVGGPPHPREREIIGALLDAVEVACLASGCHRIVLNLPRITLGFIERRGYKRIDERCAGGWIEKTVG